MTRACGGARRSHRIVNVQVPTKQRQAYRLTIPADIGDALVAAGTLQFVVSFVDGVMTFRPFDPDAER